MARRLDIELTSTRDDGTWTWRAAGARQPRGELDGSLLPDGAKVGDVHRVEADAHLDGLTVTAVLTVKSDRSEPTRLELLGSGADTPLVTTQLAPKRGRGGRDRGDDRGGRRRDGSRRERQGGRERGDGRGRSDKGGKDRRQRDGRDRKGGDRAKNRPQSPSRPKAKRLRPRRTHRDEVVGALPELQRPLADEVLKGGVPGLRSTIDQMNERAVAAGMPKIKGDPLLLLAEKLEPKLRSAEWRDRAEAALSGIAEIDLRDIRSVVAAADSAARDSEAREMADKLRQGLTERVDTEHRNWLDELAKTLAEGRTVRALRLSSRPPKAGAPLPNEIAERLVEAASQGLTADVTQDRWSTVLDAVAFSPICQQVVPAGLPAEPGDALMSAVRKVANRVPQIAAAFGVEASTSRSRRRPTPPPPPSVTEATPVAEPDAQSGAPAPEATADS